jgi:hypothetical protein
VVLLNPGDLMIWRSRALNALTLEHARAFVSQKRENGRQTLYPNGSAHE